MSPFLKQNLPMGSLGSDVAQTPNKSEAEKSLTEMVSLGWKMQSLVSVADSLLASATRLGEEIERETSYWSQVLEIKEQGWSLSRLPREKHTLGVRYGFAEGDNVFELMMGRYVLMTSIAHTDFRDRGLAALRRDEEGNLDLDLGTRSSGNRTLQVSILRQGRPIASYAKACDESTAEISPVKLLLQARDSIYDEELYHELHREARSYISQGVRSIDGKILIPYEQDKEIEIDLVTATNGRESVGPEDRTCESIALSLRILLSHAHRQNLHQRSRLPAPIKEGKIARPVHAILRPVLENIQHSSHMQKTKTLINKIKSNLASAGLVCQIQQPNTPDSVTTLPSALAKATFPALEAQASSLTNPLQSSLIVVLPSTLTRFEIGIQTGFHPSFFGTTYRCIIMSFAPGSVIAEMLSSMHFSYFGALEDHVLSLVKLDLISLILSKHQAESKWTLISPHAGQLSRSKKNLGQNQKMTISVEKGVVRLRWQSRSTQLKAEGTVTWDESQKTHSSSAEQRSLFQVIEEIYDARLST